MEKSLQRRRFLGAVSGGLAVGVAGCVGGDDDSADDDAGDDDPADGGDDGTGGDGEGDESPDEGLAYAFGPDRIAIIDPADGEVVDEITEGIDDASWGDPRITTDLTQIFAIDDALNRVVVIDTAAREVIAEVGIGPGATHMYHPNDEEMWAHADDDGTFYVIDVDAHEVVETVESGLEAEGHGKLLYHEDLGTTGYATNVNDPGLPVIDLDAYERTDFVEFGDEGGTHYKAYGPQNGLAYAEFGDETVVVDVDADDVVDRLDFAGGMYLTPDEALLGVLDGDTIRFLDVTDEESEEVGSVDVEGGPDALRFHEEGGTTYGFTANTMNDDCAVIDLEDFGVVETLDVGAIERPEDAPFLHRSGVAGDGYFLTPAEADGTVAVVDMAAHELIAHVEVEDGVDTVQFVGDSGVGYTGRIR